MSHYKSNYLANLLAHSAFLKNLSRLHSYLHYSYVPCNLSTQKILFLPAIRKKLMRPRPSCPTIKWHSRTTRMPTPKMPSTRSTSQPSGLTTPRNSWTMLTPTNLLEATTKLSTYLCGDLLFIESVWMNDLCTKLWYPCFDTNVFSFNRNVLYLWLLRSWCHNMELLVIKQSNSVTL